ncbi:MAG: sugar ABC transporter permease [Planctomycetota bacterium]
MSRATAAFDDKSAGKSSDKSLQISTTNLGAGDRGWWAPYFFIAPFLIVFAVFIIYPLLYSLVLITQQTFGPKSSAFVGLKNISFLLQDPRFWKALTNTFVFAAGSVFVQLPISLGLALLLNRPGLRGRSFYRLVFFAPSLVGLVFVAVLFALMFQKQTGLINVSIHAIFPAFSLEFPWLEKYVMSSLIIAALWMYVGFNMVYFLAALQSVDKSLLEAAEIDGAGAWQRFLNVTLPAIAPVASFVVLLSFIGSMQLFELPYLLLGNSAGPDNRGLTVVMYLYQQGFDIGDLGYASAIGWTLALILIGFAILQRVVARFTE